MFDSRLTGQKLLHILSLLGCSAAAMAASDSGRIEEIVVTAEKRETSLMETPAAVSAFDTDTLHAAVTRDINEVGMLTPTLIVNQELVSKIFVRGVGTENLTSGGDPGVALNIDGQYVARTSAANFDLYDVERVELLRGPQGTLYGRNATGGAINIVTRAPTAEFGGDVQAEYGSYHHYRLGATLNAPLVEDKLLARVSGFTSQRDGYTRNEAPGKDLDDQDLDAARLRLRYLPMETLTVDLIADFSDADNRQAPFKILESTPSLFELPPYNGYDPVDRRAVAHDTEDVMSQKQHSAVLQVNWDTGSSTLTSITGYRDTDFYSLFDGDSTNGYFQNFYDDSEFDQFSQELRLASNSTTPLEWLVGLYYFHDDGTSRVFIDLPAFGFDIDHRADMKTEAYAAFGQATYSLTEQLRLTFGLRYSDEQRDALQVSDFGFGNVQTQDMSRDDDAWTPKFGVEYSLDADTLLYANLTKGFKSGGFVFNGYQPSYAPEKVWVLDGGVKAKLMDGRMQASLSTFYYDYTDMQVSVFEQFVGTIKNAADATIYGVEAEVVARPLEGFDINAAVSLLHTEYDEFVTQDPTQPSVPSVNLAGNELPRAPTFAATLGMAYTQAFFDIGSIVYRVDYRYQDSSYFNAFNRSRSEQPALNLLDARISVTSEDEHWEAAVFGKNLLDEFYYATILESAVEVGRPFGILAAPRTVGAQVAYHF
ncbi:Pesticin receptor [Gammaproteobacteria bacterium]|nr:TonB-dependent receptor [Gammaproteobacteria bacterium]CAG0939931.1 Pesticin receptor [Gammaproteobacteria bacterium]